MESISLCYLEWILINPYVEPGSFQFSLLQILLKVTLLMPYYRMSIISVLLLCIVVESNLH